jgi:hypothetical protein
LARKKEKGTMLYTFVILLAPAPDDLPLGIFGNPIQYLQCDRLIAAIEPDVDIEALKLLPEQSLMQAIVNQNLKICQFSFLTIGLVK